ncbi:phage tail spike protein [Clostridium perfringens]|nr:phage tail spike protein [Clostridium perfringens]
MLKLKDKNKNLVAGLINYKDLCIESILATGDKKLSFSLHKEDKFYNLIEEECYIETKEAEFVIKARDVGVDYTRFDCVLNLEELEANIFDRFESVEQTITASLNLAIVGTGWTVKDNTLKKKRTVRCTNKNALEIVQEIKKTYRVDIVFNTLKREIEVYEHLGEDKGTYFIDSLNLTALQVQSDSYKFATRIIAEGKDGLTFSPINNGKNYVENFQYSKKIKTIYWKDERYTIKESLLEDAKAKLEEISKPFTSYNASVLNLAELNPKYKSILDYSLGDTITLLSKSNKVKDKQRIVKTVEYPQDHSRDTVELANAILKFEDIQQENQETTDTVNNITSDNGTLDSNAIEDNSIEIKKIDNFEANVLKVTKLDVINANIENLHANKADIQDLNAVKARIGTLEATKANITQLNAVSAEISKLSALKADITDLNAANGKINVLESKTASIDNLLAGNLTANNFKANSITAGSGIIADGAIGSAQISSLSVNKLEAGDITTSKHKIVSSDGTIEIVGNQILINRNNVNRVILGEYRKSDGTTEYGLLVRAKDGQTIMLDGNGVHNAGITDGAIDNNKVADNANISGNKLDINSVIREVNNNGTETIKGTKVTVGDRTLDVELSTQKNTITEHGKELSSQKATIQALDNAIKLKVDSQTFTQSTTVINNNINKAKEDAINSANNNISSAIDNLKIGGRNLAQLTEPKEYSSFDGRVNDCQMGYEILLDTLNVGDPVTVSYTFSYENLVPVNNHNDYDIWLQGCGDVTEWNLGGFPGGDRLTPKINWGVGNSDSFKVEYTFKLEANAKKNKKWFTSFRMDYIQSGKVSVKEFMVEYGTKATDYTEAPEDLKKYSDDVAKAKSDLAKTEAIANADGKITEEERKRIQQAQENLNTAIARAEKAKQDAINTASSDATNKANNALNSAKAYTNTEITTVNTHLNKATAEINILKEKIESKVSQSDIDKSISEIKLGDRNLITKDINNLKTWNIVAFPERIEIINNKYDNILNFKNTSSGWEVLYKAINVNPNKYYVLSFDYSVFKNYYCLDHYKFKLEISTSIPDNNVTKNVIAYHEIENIQTELKRVSLKFKPLVNTIYLVLNGGYLSDNQSNIKFNFNKFKLIEGNKTTDDWTPAPEDTDQLIIDNIKTVTDKITTVESKLTQENNSIKASVQDLNSTTQSITTNVSNINRDLSNKINSNLDVAKNFATDVATNKANTAKQEAINTANSNTTNVINNLQIGDRNLAFKTDSESVQVGNNTVNQTQSMYGLNIEELKGKKITISFDWSVDGENISGTFYTQLNNTPWTNFTDTVTVSNSNKKGHITKTINMPNEISATSIMCRKDNFIGTLKIRKLKIVIGNKIGDWSPAPEDLQAYADEVAKAKSELAKQQAIADSDGKITEEERKRIQQAQENLNTAIARADKAKQDAINAASVDATNKTNNALNSAKAYVNAEITTVNNKVHNVESNLNILSDRINTKVSQSDIDKAVTTIRTERIIYARGTGNDYPSNSLVKVNGKIITDGQGRGLRIHALNKITLELIFLQDYDTYGDGNAINNFANKINELNNGDYIIIVTSQDASYPLNPTVKGALEKIGATLFDNKQGTFREAYALIGKSKLGRGNGVEMFIPRTANDKRFAEVSVKVGEDGTFIGVNPNNMGLEATLIKSNISDVSSSVTQLRDSVTTDIRAINSKTQSIETTLGGKASKQEVTEVNNRVATIKANLDSITQRVSSTESKTNSLETNINGKASKQEVNNVSSKVVSLETNLNGITNRVSNTESRINTLNGQVANAVTIQQFTEFKQSNKDFQLKISQTTNLHNLVPNGTFAGGLREWICGGEFWNGSYTGYGFSGKICGAVKNKSTSEKFLTSYKAFKVEKNTTYTLNFHYKVEQNVQSMEAFVMLSNTESGDYGQIIKVMQALGGERSDLTNDIPHTFTFNTGNFEWVWLRFDHNGMKQGTNWDEYCWLYISEVAVYKGSVGAVKYLPKSGENYDTTFLFDGMGFQGNFDDGSYAYLGKEGLEWYNAGTGHAYHALTYVTSFDIPIGNPGKAYIKLPAEFTKRRSSLKWTVALRGYYYSTDGDFFPFHIHCTGGRDYIENGLVVCEVQGYCKIQNAQNAGDVQFRPLTAMLIAIA